MDKFWRKNRGIGRKTHEEKLKITAPINETFEHLVHLDPVEVTRDHGKDVTLYRRAMDPKLQKNVRNRNDSLYVRIPAVGTELMTDMIDEFSRISKTQSMDDLDNYVLVGDKVPAKESNTVDYSDGLGPSIPVTYVSHTVLNSTTCSTQSGSPNSTMEQDAVMEMSKSVENLTITLKDYEPPGEELNYLAPRLTVPPDKQLTDRERKIESLLIKFSRSNCGTAGDSYCANEESNMARRNMMQPVAPPILPRRKIIETDSSSTPTNYSFVEQPKRRLSSRRSKSIDANMFIKPSPVPRSFQPIPKPRVKDNTAVEYEKVDQVEYI